MKKHIILSVSSSACTELGNPHSILTESKKLNRLKKINNSPQIRKSSEDTGQTSDPKIEKTDK